MRPSEPTPAAPTGSAPGEPSVRPSRWLHVVLHHAGGVGGSFVAALLAEYLTEQLGEEDRACGALGPSRPVLGLDLARNAGTFSRYEALDVRRVRADAERGAWSFADALGAAVEAAVAELPPGGVAVADLSTTGFLEFFAPRTAAALAPALAEAGLGLVLHAVGRPEVAVSAPAAAAYARQPGLPADTPAVCWLNDVNDAHALADGACVPGMLAGGALAAVLAGRYRLAGVVHVPAITSERYGPGAAFTRTSARASSTLGEAVRAPGLDRLARHRLAAVRDDVFGQLARALDAVVRDAAEKACPPKRGR